MMEQNLIDRFRSYVQKSDDGCWVWAGSANQKGYGKFNYPPGDGRRQTSMVAHKFYFWMVTGDKVPEGFDLHHACHNKRCVRYPDHVVLMSGEEHDRLSNAERIENGTHNFLKANETPEQAAQRAEHFNTTLAPWHYTSALRR